MTVDGATHRHRWTGVDFYIDGDRPMVRQTCACGARRDIRAFDRTWIPPSGTTERAGHDEAGTEREMKHREATA